MSKTDPANRTDTYVLTMQHCGVTKTVIIPVRRGKLVFDMKEAVVKLIHGIIEELAISLIGKGN